MHFFFFIYEIILLFSFPIKKKYVFFFAVALRFHRTEPTGDLYNYDFFFKSS